jgi:hypothetical protein
MPERGGSLSATAGLEPFYRTSVWCSANLYLTCNNTTALKRRSSKKSSSNCSLSQVILKMGPMPLVVQTTKLIVKYHQASIAGAVDIQFDKIDAQGDTCLDRSFCVLRSMTCGSAMADAKNPAPIPVFWDVPVA